MEIERPSVDDVDALVALWVDLADGQRSFGSHLRAGANREAIRESLSRRVVAGGCHVACDPELVGFVTFFPEAETYERDCQRGVVENLYVVPDRRGEGIGAALLCAAEETLADGGADVISLEVLAENGSAREFYARHGYTPHRVELERPIERETDTSDGE